MERDGLDTFIDGIVGNRYSWTWKIEDTELLGRVAVDVRRWAEERFGPLDQRPAGGAPGGLARIRSPDATMSDSVSFDPAAEHYDETRSLTPEASRAVTDLLANEIHGSGPCLEIGVGTGLIALPLHDAGIRMVGLDLSAAMLRKLVEKTGGRPAFPLLRGDATRLPFADAVFGAAILRHVLHLIPAWQVAVGELARVVRPGGVLLLNIGTEGGPWQEMQDRLETAAGPGSQRVGLTAKDHAVLDETLERLGARFRELPPVWERSRDYTPERYLQEAGERVFSWTWNVPADRLTAAIDGTRAWAEERFGSLDTVLEPRYQIVWRAYDVPA